jgi:hypothetical protein
LDPAVGESQVDDEDEYYSAPATPEPDRRIRPTKTASKNLLDRITGRLSTISAPAKANSIRAFSLVEASFFFFHF